MIYLTKAEILRLNERTIILHGGNYLPPDNILHHQPLEYVIEIVASELFGQPTYPQVWDKAAVYMFNIISNHCFSDGNKRTGLAAALYFLALNNYQLKSVLDSASLELAPQLDKHRHLEAFTLHVAAGMTTLDQVRQWFKVNIEPTPDTGLT